MAKIFKYTSRALVIALCFVVLGAVGVASAQPKPAGQSAPPKKKKLPPGAKGFEQFADRDASDKLVTGGATRGQCENYEQLIECAIGQAGSNPPNLKEAIEFLTQAAALKPDMFLPQYMLGQIHESSGKYKEAEAAYKLATERKAVEPDESVLMAYFNLGNVYAMMNDHPKAIAAFEAVTKEMPTAHTAHYNAGLSHAVLGKHKAAVDAFKEAIKHKPDYWQAHYNMGLAHTKLEEYPQAVGSFKKALEHNADNEQGKAQAHYNLGVVYFLMDDAKAFAEVMKTLENTKPDMAKELAKLNGQ